LKILEKKKKITKDHFIVDRNQIYAGSHLIIDLWYTRFDNKIDTLKGIIKKAVLIANATILHIHLHRFGKEEGISGVAILAESHISVHTWPERDYIAFDIFMCGDTKPKDAAQYLIDTLKPKKNKITDLRRGVISID
jgi:S-adenosylmethionine decarboxylase